MKKVFFTFFSFLALLITIHYQLPTVSAQGFDIGKSFGFGDIGSVASLLDRFIGPAFSIAAIIVLFFFIQAALKYLLSGSNKDELAKARGMVTHAIIGFLLLMFIFLLLQFIYQFLGLGAFQIIR